MSNNSNQLDHQQSLQPNDQLQILMVGGGTAGHVEPALAVAHEIQNLRADIQIQFVGTKNGLENRLVPSQNFELKLIPKVLLPRKFTPAVFIWPFKLILAVIKSIKLVSKANLVVGFGGYACPPIYLAAALLRKPIYIHEANAVKGWANKLGALFASQIYIAFASAKSRVGTFRKAKLIGMPLRAAITKNAHLSNSEKAQLRSKQIKAWGLNENHPIILVFGGSQGSRHINEAILQSMSFFTDNQIQVVHAVGRDNALPLTTENYIPLAYIEDMASAYLACDLVIARSGALTCGELAVVGKYAVLVPLPIGNGEQAANAKDLESAGAAQLIANDQFNASWLMSNFDQILQRATNYRPNISVGKTAAAIMAEDVVEFFKNQNRK